MLPSKEQIKAAQKAADEVSLKYRWRWNMPIATEEMIIAILTAAAEVGCGCIYPQDCAEKISATIERCARVAENYQVNSITGQCLALDIAAAIRALKDKPPIDQNLQYPGKDPDFVFPEE